MADQWTSQAETIKGPTVSFDPIPYRADGSIALGSGLQLIGILGITGLILGIIAGFIARIFYLVLLFPIVIGAIIGAVGSRCIKRFHVRNPLICGFAGFFAGCLAMFTMHYTEFRFFEKNLIAELGEEGLLVREIALRQEQIHANWDNATEEEREVLTELEKNPEGLMALRANNVFRYIDLMAHNGVEINNGRGAGGRGFNLGYTGSYIYWVVESLIVAGIAYSVMSGAAGEPYCSQCGHWKTGQLYGPFAEPKQISQLMQGGMLTPISPAPEGVPSEAMVTLFHCPECHAEGETDVLVEHWTVNGKGETTKKRLSLMTYPASALPVLVAVCTLPEPVQTLEEEAISADPVLSEESGAALDGAEQS